MDDVKYLDAESVFSALSPAEAVDALTRVLAAGFDPEDDIPRTIRDVSAGNMIMMPAEIGDWVGVKLVGVAVRNAELGLPRIQGQYLMYDSRTMTLRAILDGTALTTLRTPAVSVAAVRPAFSRFTDPVRLVVFGAGPQGIGHVDTLAAVLDVGLAEATFVVRHPDRVDAVVRERGRVLRAGSAEVDAALAAADIVVTATTARTPLFSAELVRPGAVVLACGSHDPDARELPGGLMRSATVVVESMSTVLREGGDVVLAIQEGALDAESLVTMKQFTAAEAPAPEDRTVVFKGSGMSWEDLAVATTIVERATGEHESAGGEPVSAATERASAGERP
ncbi:ornithine cyclodeaminase [Brevibacterium sanguinis]|uniref:Ornithine cyclodeaminase n=2 Tax=Brevibacterium TaxID=1696 RepID=A0A366IMJ1_9MICO|nr:MULTISPECIES: ornithine cyclodeaminase family protein [Brevibacterium]RBP67187.1 ornithine cyclodeaminase [Brevibacterium sanguinis]RBP73712.1 ornithine cyclodeaminase [Brevibacterium celere]